MSANKENIFRSRFHSRGLLNKSRLNTSANSSYTASTPKSEGLQPAPQQQHNEYDNHNPCQMLQEVAPSQPDLQTNSDLCSRVDSTAILKVNSESSQQEFVQSKTKEIIGTPSVSLRKYLLDKDKTPSYCNREGSPVLRRQMSSVKFEKIKSAVRTQLESSHLGTSFNLSVDRDSPGLTRLRQTPGKPLKEKRQILVNKHNETRCNADALNIGGGVSLWPQMDDMRLSKPEAIKLALVSLFLVFSSCLSFSYIHGNSLLTLQTYREKLSNFSLSHPIEVFQDGHLLNTSRHWHTDFDMLVGEIETTFLVSSNDVKSCYMFCVGCGLYVSGVGILLYYLADNVMSSSKLSPNRIKKWICLLAVVGCWTINVARLFFEAFMIEKSVVSLIQSLTVTQKEVITKYIKTGKCPTSLFQQVASYWSSKYLSSQSDGVINILGIVKFNTLLYYMQYYCVPILTALLSPIVKLVFSLLHIYGIIEHTGYTD